MEMQVKFNNLQVSTLLKNMTRKQKTVVKKGLNRASNMAILMITKRTQSGKLPDGGRMLPYAKGTLKNRKKRGRQTGFVDLTDTGKMFRSLDFRQAGLKNTLFFSNMERAKIASFHDTFGAGKGKVVRPFFAIGKKEEEKLQKDFAQFYFKEMRI
tara:strand:+ start:8843 stop:9307 length:465 start_codon:yes stop_codon:yes gene_type:complete